jgi:hypothetical protein
MVTVVVLVVTGTVVALGSAPAVARGSLRPARPETAFSRPAHSSHISPTCQPEPDKPCPQGNDVWAGYVATPLGSTFTAVSASWVQTRAQCPENDAWALFWVGLDGSSDMSVQQGGSEAQCTGGVPHYYAWWEMYPSDLIQQAFSVAVGDHISSSVVYSSAADTYTVTVDDITSGQSLVVVCWTDASPTNADTYTVTEDGVTTGPSPFVVDGVDQLLCPSSDPCANSSAEWIVEAPGGDDGSLYPLAHFQPVSFRAANAVTASGQTGPITDTAWEHSALDLTATNETVLASVSGLKEGGKRFRVVWHQSQ